MILMASIALLLAAGTLVYAIRHAPEGFEDEAGFHSLNTDSRLAATVCDLRATDTTLTGLPTV